MNRLLFLGDSITDADHLFDPANLGSGYVAMLAEKMTDCLIKNRGHNGFTIEQIHRYLLREGIEDTWSSITLLAGVNDVPVEVYTSRKRIPDEFYSYFKDVLAFLSTKTKARLFVIEPFLFNKPEEYRSWQRYITIESEIIQELTASFHGIFIPTRDALHQAVEKWGIDTITTDGIHLTSLGNEILAGLWHTAYTKSSL